MAKSMKTWQAESDARTLGEAEVIKTNPTRLSSAKKAAQKLETEAQANAKAMSKVADGKVRSIANVSRRRPPGTPRKNTVGGSYTP